MFDILHTITERDLVQIGILWVIVYWTLRYLENTIAGGFFRSIGMVSVIVVIVALMLFKNYNLDALAEIFNYFIIFAFISVVALS